MPVTPTVYSGTEVDHGGEGTSFSLAVTRNVGDWIVFALTVDGTSAPTVQKGGSTWSGGATPVSGTQSSAHISVWYKQVAAGEDTGDIGASWSGTQKFSYGIWVLPSADIVGFLSAVSSSYSSKDPFTSDSITPSATPSLVITGVGGNGSHRNPTYPAGSTGAFQESGDGSGRVFTVGAHYDHDNTATGEHEWDVASGTVAGLGFSLAFEVSSGGGPVTGEAKDTGQQTRSIPAASDGVGSALSESSADGSSIQRTAGEASHVAGSAVSAGSQPDPVQRAAGRGIGVPGANMSLGTSSSQSRSVGGPATAQPGPILAGGDTEPGDFVRGVPGFSSVFLGGVIGESQQTPTADRRVLDSSSHAHGSLSKASASSQRQASAQPGSVGLSSSSSRESTAGTMTRTASDLVRLSGLVGTSTPASIQRLVTGSASYTVGSYSKGAAQAPAVSRQASAGAALKGGVTGSSLLPATIIRTVPGFSLPLAALLKVSRSSTLTRTVSGASSYLVDPSSSLSLTAGIVRSVPGFSDALTEALKVSISAQIQRIVPGASSAVVGNIVEQATTATLSRLAGLGSYVVGGVSGVATIARITRSVPGFSDGGADALITPVDQFTIKVPHRGILMAPAVRGVNILIPTRGAIMAVSRKKVHDFPLERSQTKDAVIPWSLDFEDRMDEYGVSSISAATAQADKNTLTVGTAQVSGNKVSIPLGPATEETDYTVTVQIEFGAPPYKDEAVLILKVRDVPIG